MLLTLLLVARVGCEWVEISQHHYRKPVRPTHNYPFFSTLDKVTEVYIDETSITNKSYMNHTVTEFNWNKGAVQRTSNTGNIRRVQLMGSNVKTNTVQNISEFNNYGPTIVENVRSEEESNLGTVQKVPNIGIVKRVQLENSPVKSPSIKIKPAIENSYSNKEIPNDLTNYGQNHDVNEKSATEMKKDSHHNRSNENAFSRNTERVPLSTFPTDNYKYNKTVALEENPLYTLMDLPKEDTFNKQETSDHLLRKEPFIDSNIKSTNTEKIFLKTESTESDKKDSNHVPSITKISKSITKEGLIIENDKLDGATVTSINLSKNQYDANKADKVSSDKTLPDTKLKTIENVVKFMKIVADTISRNTKRNINSKLSYLQELRDTILADVEDRLDATWPDDLDKAGARRRSRSAHAAPRGHVEFPSSEGALMTISFLTFAVFLIKLVLQVIHTYKNKAMMVAPLVVAAAGRAASKDRG